MGVRITKDIASSFISIKLYQMSLGTLDYRIPEYFVVLCHLCDIVDVHGVKDASMILIIVLYFNKEGKKTLLVTL